MTKGRWIAFAAICVLIFGALIINTKSNEVKVSNIEPSKVIVDNKPLPDHVFGTDTKKTILIEYGDFQCPACGSLYPSLKPLKEHYKDQLTFVFRDFPLTTIHPNALAGASAAEAAGLQDKFWEMHDMLYENQTEWSSLDSTKRTDQFALYAARLGLDTAKFKKDLNSKKVSQKIKRDQALGKKIGASSTPTLVLNGETLEQAKWQTPAVFENTIRDAIKASGQTLPEKMPQSS
jgi:protein-disulfide isomerase